MDNTKKKNLYIIGSSAAAVIVIALILFLALSSCGGGKYDKYYSQAEEAYLDKDYSTALDKLEKAVAAEPKAEAYLLMAEIYSEQGNIDMAIQVLYLGYSKTGDAAVASRLENLKKLKNGDIFPPSTDSIDIAGNTVPLDSDSLVLMDMGLTDSDISSIGMVSGLESLSLSDNKLTSISALSSLSQLTFLQISENSISDLSPIRSLTKLKTLYIDGNPITDFTPLYALTSLRTLSMKSIEITESQLTELQEALPNCSIYSDKAIEEVVEITLGTQTFMSDVTELSLSGQYLLDLSPLSKCTKLTSLDLHGSRVEDISALIDLQALTHLDISDNKIKDLSPLMSLEGLVYLNAENNNISDVAVLGYLPALEELYLSGNELSSGLSSLGKLENLQKLTLRSTGLTDEDLGTLSGLKNLTELNIEDNSELTANEADKLKAALPNCTIKASDLLYTVTFGEETYKSDAESVTALSAGVSDLNGLEKFTALKSLLLTNNSVSSIEPIKDIMTLEELDLYANNVSDLSPLKNHSSLRILDLSRNQIGDISALSTCTGLEELHLSYNSISGITALSSCTGLTELDLDNNSIVSISALSSLKSLTTLNLDNNRISDLSPLYSLSNLKILYIRGNDLTSDSILSLQSALPNCTIICDADLITSAEMGDTEA